MYGGGITNRTVGVLIKIYDAKGVKLGRRRKKKIKTKQPSSEMFNF